MNWCKFHATRSTVAFHRYVLYTQIFTSSRLHDTTIFWFHYGAGMLLSRCRMYLPQSEISFMTLESIIVANCAFNSLSVLDRGSLKSRNEMMSAGVELIGGSSLSVRGAESPIGKKLYKTVEVTVQILTGNCRKLHSPGMKWDYGHRCDGRRRSSASILSLLLVRDQGNSTPWRRIAPTIYAIKTSWSRWVVK